MKNIKNIIFDLGGVIINLDTSLTQLEFNKLSQVPFESIYAPNQQIELFSLFDKGTISEYEFFKELKKQIRHQGPDEELLAAWNAMLLDIPEKRLDVLVKMKQNYNTYLLSNTCEPHIEAIQKYLYNEHGVKDLSDYFDGVYYSCRLGMRKPEKKIFEHLLQNNALNPEETVFIDDSIQHVKGAGECGINAYLLPQGMEVGDLLKDLKLL
jgi:glucose-1-phosphatase